MKDIEVSLVSIEDLLFNSRLEYESLLSKIDYIISSAKQKNDFVQSALDSISNRISKASTIYYDAEAKANIYKEQMDIIMVEINYYNQQINYLLEHPTIVTDTDDNGNTCTEEAIDYNAINALERQLQKAEETYDYYEKKYNKIIYVKEKIYKLTEQLNMIKNAIMKLQESIQVDIFEISKYDGDIKSEADYNCNSLRSVQSCIQNYLCSKKFNQMNIINFGSLKSINISKK